MTATRGLLAIAVMLTGMVMITARPAAADQPRVVATIKPVHALVAGVMEGVATPDLILHGGGSPHSYALKPSQAASLAGARLVVRVSEHLETFLNKPIEALSDEDRVLTLEALPGLIRHDIREGGLWEAHEHGDHDGHHGSHAHGETDHGHDHRHASDSAHETAHDHGGEEGKGGEAGSESHAGHGDAGHGHADHGHAGHGHNHEMDTHIWLDPENARVIVDAVAKELSRLWPEHAGAFAANASRMSARLAALDAELQAATAPLSGKPYIVFHDAYRYFEERYGLRPAGSITVSAQRTPGAKRLLAIRKRIENAHAICVFAEPQFEPALVGVLIEGTGAREGVLDPLGASLPDGPDLYFSLMRDLAASLTACLSP